MRFQERDGKILKDIHDNDGVMALRHLKNIQWPGKSWRAMERRVKKLHDAGYLERPTREQYIIFPIPEPICWLGWRGAQFIAGTLGIEIDPPPSSSVDNLRDYQKRLRKLEVRWVREPRWSLLRHDLAVIDFRLAVERATREASRFTLGTWVRESVFRTKTDVVTYRIRDQDGNVKRVKKGVCPDGCFEILDEELRVRGEQGYLSWLLLEVDMATHDNPSFGREKVKPGVAYIDSKIFKERFGHSNVRWLVVTGGGETRIRNLIRQTHISTKLYSYLFYFTTLDQLENGNVLTSPIWMQVGCREPKPLFDL